jgi:hypothetical protein
MEPLTRKSMRIRRKSLLIAALAGAVAARAAVCRSGSGSEVYRYLDDAALNRRWAVMIDCAHPNYPASIVSVSGASVTGARIPEPLQTPMRKTAFEAPPPVVTAGMRVVLWSEESRAVMRFTGTALAAARTGETVRVRVGFEGRVLTGVVRGPGSVELVPAAAHEGKP